MYANLVANYKKRLTSVIANKGFATKYQVMFCEGVKYLVMAKNINTLGKYDQRRLWKFICIANPFDLFLFIYFLNHKNLTFHWIRILNGGGGVSLWNKCLSNTHWPQLTAPFYSILFETSICQFNSSECSLIMPDEVREHLTRDQRPFLHPESLQTL